MKRIFFVEDDLSLINGLAFAMRKQGYELDIARTGAEAGQLWADGKYDLVILDVSLPDGSGFDLCKKIRKTSRVPIMFLTAADEETDIIMGLDIGGDDYITKPFKLAIFLSRVNALLRRSENFNQAETELNSNGIRICLLSREVRKNGTLVELTASEFKLLRLFMENPNIVLSPEQILSRLWDCDENFIDSNTLTVYIRRLRTKIEDNPAEPRNIVTPSAAWVTGGTVRIEVRYENIRKPKNKNSFLQRAAGHCRIFPDFRRLRRAGVKKCGALCAAFFRRHGAFGFHGHVFIFQGTKQNHGKRHFADPGLYIGRSGRQDRMRR